MIELPEVLRNAIDQLKRIPGVGEKTATRQVLSLLNWSPTEINLFAESFNELSSIKVCHSCGLYAGEDTCMICLDSERIENKTICVVENISDSMAIERSGNYRGTYHVLGGVLNPLLGIGPAELNVDKLVMRVKTFEIDNLILAINPSVEGDATCSYLKQLIGERVAIDRIGFGVPVGGSLEYLDAMTISKALENRKQM